MIAGDGLMTHASAPNILSRGPDLVQIRGNNFNSVHVRTIVSLLPNCDEEFSVQEIVEKSKQTTSKPFSASHVNQILAKLGEIGFSDRDSN